MDFQLATTYKPQGDQPRAISELVSGLAAGEKDQVLLGVTGSGKTFTMAKIIEQVQRPALILAHNKTLAAQLYHEFKSFFPTNAVEYFVSYYDYYQPEAYIPAGDLFIEKEATINEELDKLRLSATRSLFERRDCIIVSSVSCIYGLGSPEAYYGMLLLLERGQKIKREDITRRLVEILYDRNDVDFRRGTFRVRGDIIEVYPTYDENAYRIELFGDEIDSLSQIDPLFGTVRQKYSRLPIYPKSHYVVQPERKRAASDSILAELEVWEKEFPPLLRPPPRRAPAHPARLLPPRLPPLHRRVPRHRPAAPRHVARRPLPQAEPSRLRLPPPVRHGQPPPQVRRVRVPHRPDHLRLRHPRPV
jgi:excinuclease ABC subunit B